MRRSFLDPFSGVARRGRARRERRFGQSPLELLEGRALLSFAVEGLTGIGSNAHGSTSIVANAVATDSGGDKFVTGSFYGTVDFGGTSLTSAGSSDAFVAEYTKGGTLIYAQKMGFAGNDAGQAIAVDAAGEAFVAGASGSQAFVWKLGSSGTTAFQTFMPSTSSARALGVAVGPLGSYLAIGGQFSGSTAFGSTTLTAPAGSQDGFLARLDGSGSFVWASQFVGSAGSSSQINSVAIDSTGNTVGAGQFSGSVDFDPTAASSMRATLPGATDYAVVSLKGADGSLAFAATGGTSGFSAATGIAAALGGRLYVTGAYQNTVHFGASTLTAPASPTAFYLMGINASGGVSFVNDLGATNSDLTGTMIGRPSVATNAVGSVVVGTTFTGNVSTGRFHLGGTGASDLLIESFDGKGSLTRALSAGGLVNDSLTGVAVDAAGDVAFVGSYGDLIVVDTKALVDKFDTSIPGSNILVGTLGPVSGVTYGFDGSSQTEPATFNPGNSSWTVLTSNGTVVYGVFGNPGDIPVSGDWSQFGHAQLAVYRPSTAQWLVQLPNGTAILAANFGAANSDLPVPGDFDGLGETEPAVYRPSTGQWFVDGPYGGHVVGTLGLPGDVPVSGDYDGVGHAEPAVFRPSTGQWLVLGPNGVHQIAVFGGLNLTDIPVPGDYDRVGHTEPAVYRPSTGQWFAYGPNGGHLVTTFGGGNLAASYPVEGVPGSIMAISQAHPMVKPASTVVIPIQVKPNVVVIPIVNQKSPGSASNPS
jgi:hypothetical protein